jgi:hypothetical protein
MMRWAVHVTLLRTKRERERLVCGIFVGKPKGKRPLEKLGIHGRVILKPVLKK